MRAKRPHDQKLLDQKWLIPGMFPTRTRKFIFTQGFSLAQFILVIIDMSSLFVLLINVSKSVSVWNACISQFSSELSIREVFSCYI